MSEAETVPPQTPETKPEGEQPPQDDMAPRRRGPPGGWGEGGPRGPPGDFHGPPRHHRHHDGEAMEDQRRFRHRRERGDRQAHQKVRGFIDMFSGAGMSPEKMRGIREVPLAHNMMKVSMKTGRFLSQTTKAVNEKVKAGTDSLVQKTSEGAKDVSVAPAILVGLMTLSVAFEAAKGMLLNVLEGIIEAVMKVSGALSDALHEHYRSKFDPKNDYQEIAVALLFMIGSLYSGISTFISTVWNTIQTAIIQMVLQRWGKNVSNIVLYSLTMIVVFIQLHFALLILTPKVMFFGIIFLVILSFFLKMDDLPEEEAEKEEEEKKEGEEKKEDEEKKEEEVKKEEEEKKEEEKTEGGEKKEGEEATAEEAPKAEENKDEAAPPS